MSNKLKNTLGVILILLITILSSSGCVEENPSHTHVFREKYDETRHFNECECGKIENAADHIFDWVIDVEPTHIAPGVKHKECNICGYKTEENTLIEILFDVPIDPIQKDKYIFTDCSDLEYFFKSNKEKMTKNLLAIRGESNSEQGIYIVNESMNLSKYTFGYDSEQDNTFINPYVMASFSVYSIELGTDTDISQDVPFHSFTLEFVSKGCNSEFTDLRFEFADSEDSTWERVVYIYDANDKIAEVYLSFNFEIDDDWFAEYLKENLFILK